MTDPRAARAALLRAPGFRWLLGGGMVSMLGDQFTLVALPWLVLKLSGDAFALGLVVALMGVPRALFILFGGALVDRHSPKRVLMLTKFVNALLLATLSALVLAGHASLPLVGALALGIGLATAFSIPSGSAMLPQVVEPAQLGSANALMMGMRQLSLLAGPLLAAALFTLAGDASGMDALGWAFGFDCFSFLLSAWTLSRVGVRTVEPGTPQPILRAVGAGLAQIWNDLSLRSAFLYWAVCACVIGGIMQVALPVLAATRLHGASALGLLLASHSGGALAGMALTGLIGRRRLGNLGTTVLAIDMTVGLLLLPLGRVDALWQAALAFAVFGLLGGYMQVALLTWIQQRVPPAMLGRAMSIFMFIFMGLAPLTAMLTGWLMQRWSLGTVFAASGLVLVAAAALAYAFTPMRAMADATPGA